MPIRAVTLKIRVKTTTRKWYVVNPVFDAKGRLRPLYAMVAGKPERHTEGVYVLRYGNKFESVGQHLDVVVATKLRREQELLVAISEAKLKRLQPAQIDATGPKILDAMEQFLAKKSIMDPELGVDALAPKTISSMRTIIESFQRTSHKTSMKEVMGQDLVG